MPPGPLESVRVPLIASVVPPSLSTFATTSGRPVSDRSAVNAPIAKLGPAVPPDPIEMYIRTPTRLTIRTPPVGLAGPDTSAQITA